MATTRTQRRKKTKPALSYDLNDNIPHDTVTLGEYRRGLGQQDEGVVVQPHQRRITGQPL